MKGAGLQRVQFPPGNWFAPPGSNRGGSGGNKAVGALGVKGRMATPWRNISIALEGQPGRKDNKAHTSVWRAGSRGSGCRLLYLVGVLRGDTCRCAAAMTRLAMAHLVSTLTLEVRRTARTARNGAPFKLEGRPGRE